MEMYAQQSSWGQYYDFTARESEKRDMEYMKTLYSKQMRIIQDEIEDKCDRLEYDGSMMFDEYPDRLMLSIKCKEVIDKCKEDDNKKWIDDIVPILFYGEMYRRRCRRRNCRRFY